MWLLLVNCPLAPSSKYSQVGDHLYFYNSQPLTNGDAVSACAQDGARLAMPKTKFELSDLNFIVPQGANVSIGIGNPDLVACSNAACSNIAFYEDGTPVSNTAILNTGVRLDGVHTCTRFNYVSYSIKVLNGNLMKMLMFRTTKLWRTIVITARFHLCANSPVLNCQVTFSLENEI